MRTLSTADLLAVWEQGAAQSLVGRALLLLRTACPDQSRETLAVISIGERDTALLELRERMFGPTLHGLATCPRCHDVLELTFSANDIRGAASKRLPSEPDGTALSWRFPGYELQIRLPDSRDLEAVATLNNVSEARRKLFERCVLGAQRDGVACPAEEVPDEVVQSVEELMAEVDPHGDVQLSLTCPHCCHRWQAGFDIVSFLWSEIHARALRLLEDVHVLASAYGWCEVDILALSPWRRQAYLELVGQ